MNTSIMCYAFPGFYGTLYDESDVTFRERQNLESEYGGFLEHLDDWDLIPDYRQRVCKGFVEKYVEELTSTLGLKMELIAFKLRSPFEYNFTNDDIRIDIEVGDWEGFISKITKMMDDPEYRTQLAGIIKTHHTSRDGFWSWMSNDIEDWYALILDPENTNYIGCILWYLYCLKSGEDIGGNSNWGIADQVYDYLSSNTDVFCLSPTTDKAKEEYEKYMEEVDRIYSMPALPLFED